MSCEKCQEAQKGPGVAMYRWKTANVGMLGCDEHLKEIFEVLRNHQHPKESKRSYIHEQLKGKDREFISGFRQGIIAFAHWKDGSQHVGTCGTTLKSVLTEINEYVVEHQQDDM